MGTAAAPQRAKLVLAIMYADEKLAQTALVAFSESFGAVDYAAGPLDFDRFTDYYRAESGAGLCKRYYAFEALIERDSLPSIKNAANLIEARFAADGKRRVNLDPGYLTNDKLVLASTKDFYHRIYLGEGIYAETTLHFRKGRFRRFSWTYPDYMDERVLDFLTRARADLVGRLRKQG
jgi:hypothetical protein